MGVVISTASQNGVCDSLVDSLDAGSSGTYNEGTIKIYTANFVTLLSEIPFSNPAFGDSVLGVATALNVPITETSANDSGLAEAFTFVNTDDVPILSGTVSAVGGDITLSNTTISMGDVINITALTVTMPTGTL